MPIIPTLTFGMAACFKLTSEPVAFDWLSNSFNLSLSIVYLSSLQAMVVGATPRNKAARELKLKKSFLFILKKINDQ